MKKEQAYYDIPMFADIEGVLIENNMLDDVFYLRDLKQRKIYIQEDICEDSVREPIRHILQFNREDHGIQPENRSPILLYLSSNGGDLDAGFELIDVILNSKTPVYTINLAQQYSLGFLIGIAGHVRYATPNAKFLMHDGNSFLHNSGAKVRDEMRFQEQLESRIEDYVIEHTKITKDKYTDRFREEWYMFADEAKENGIVDFIVGVDCDVDDIV